MPDERVALVTGGSRGIGKAVCQALAGKGFKVVVNHARKGSADEVLQQIEKNDGTALGVQADISREDEVKAMIEKVLDHFGRIDCLINNAGISDQIVPVVEQESSKWQRLIDIHLKGTYVCSKEAAKSMIQNRYGRIVNVASIAGLTGFPMRTAYGPAKSAVMNLTKILAIEWAPYHINVNAVAPGYIRTELVEDLIQAGTLNEETICNRIPARRLGRPDEIAKVVLFLLSDDSDYITGETLVVDGGWLAYGFI